MEEVKAEKTSGGGSGKLLMVVVLLNTIVAGGAFASSYLRGPAGAAPAAKAGAAEGGAEAAEAAPAAEGEHGTARADGAAKPNGKEEASRPVARIDNLIVRLRNPELDRFARITLDVELGKAADLGAFQSNVPRVRDAVITTIADCTAEQLAGSQGMNKLKADLVQNIAAVVPGASIKAVYLSDFVVQ